MAASAKAAAKTVLALGNPLLEKCVIYVVILLKEVLRRENQGLKVHPVDGSSVFSMTGTYF
jgi:hypothetical protein